jgi:hypothetical protein
LQALVLSTIADDEAAEQVEGVTVALIEKLLLSRTVLNFITARKAADKDQNRAPATCWPLVSLQQAHDHSDRRDRRRDRPAPTTWAQTLRRVGDASLSDNINKPGMMKVP